MRISALKMVILGAALSLSATGILVASGGDENTMDRCEPTQDLKITTARVDIDKKGESEIRGKIVNDARSADYRDVRVRINFLDDSGDQIGSQIATVKGNFKDGDTEDFIIKFEAPSKTEQATYSVECAVRE